MTAYPLTLVSNFLYKILLLATYEPSFSPSSPWSSAALPSSSARERVVKDNEGEGATCPCPFVAASILLLHLIDRPTGQVEEALIDSVIPFGLESRMRWRNSYIISVTLQIVYRVTAYRVDAGYRVGFFKNQIIYDISIVQIVCL